MSTETQTQEPAGAIVPLGYVFAVLMPIIGLILGIIAATRPNKSTSKHGAWIIAVSAIAFIIYVILIIHAAQQQAQTQSLFNSFGNSGNSGISLTSSTCTNAYGQMYYC